MQDTTSPAQVARSIIDNVSTVIVGKTLVMKRGRPRARGRFGRIMKPFSQLTIKVRQVEEQA